MTTRAPELALEQIDKRFGALQALQGAAFTVRPGSVHALLGENGAGKSTLMRIAFGALQPDAGVIRVNGVPVRFPSPAAARAAGIGMVHQHFTSVPRLSVAENVALGGKGRLDVAAARDRVQEIGGATGLVLDPDVQAGSLPVGGQQRLELVKALATGARLLILDEPTAALGPSEVDDLLRVLRDFVAGDASVVIITHKLREALSLADDITVLRRGRTVVQERAARLTERTLAESMLGAAAPVRRLHLFRREAGGEVVASATDLVLSDEHGTPRIQRASFTLRQREIVGVAAVEGSGQRELLRALGGLLPPTTGKLSLPPTIGFIPGDRQHDGLVTHFPLYENIALRGAGARRGRIRWEELRIHTATLLVRFDVRASGRDVLASELSGGNQQKLVLARELDHAPALVVAENPTRGLDVTATVAVLDRLREARDAGAAVVVYSTDLDEVIDLADRVLVIHAGHVREMGCNHMAVGHAMLGLG